MCENFDHRAVCVCVGGGGGGVVADTQREGRNLHCLFSFCLYQTLMIRLK